MRLRIWTCAVMFMLSAGRGAAQEILSEKVTPPFPIPVGEGLFRVASAEPVGRGSIVFRSVVEAYGLTVGKVGQGSSLTGHLGLGYGLGNNVDFLVSVPVLFDIAGGLAKYGTGDVNTTLKFGFPARTRSG